MIALLFRLWFRLPRLVRVAASGGAATAADTTTLFALCWGVGLSAGIAAVLGCLVGGAVNFAITRSWIFSGGARPWLAQALRYGVIVVGGGAVVSGVAVAALVAAGAPLIAAKAGAVVIALVAWNYPMSARVVFAPRSTETAGAALTADRPGDPDALVLLR